MGRCLTGDADADAVRRGDEHRSANDDTACASLADLTLLGDAGDATMTMAAVLGVEIYLIISKKSRLRFDNVYFWSDSMTVLRYIQSNDLRLPVFEKRRVTAILEATTAGQWHYVSTDENPADVATRGTHKLERWLTAPTMLFDSARVPVYGGDTCIDSADSDNNDLIDRSLKNDCVVSDKEMQDRMVTMTTEDDEAACSDSIDCTDAEPHAVCIEDGKKTDLDAVCTAAVSTAASPK